MKLLVNKNTPEELNEFEGKLLKLFVEETLTFFEQSMKDIDFSTFESMKYQNNSTNKAEHFLGSLGLMVQKGADIDGVLEEINKYIKDNTILEFVRNARDLALTYNAMKNTANIVFKKLVLLVIRAYNQGKVEGIDLSANDGEGALILSDSLDSHDVILLTRLVMYFSENKLAKEEAALTLPYEELAEILDLYLGIDETGYVNALQSATIDALRRIHSTIYFTAFRTDFNSIFNQVSEEYFTPVNLPAVVLDFDQSDGFTFNATIVVTRYLSETAMFDRTRLHTKNGVRLVFANPQIGFTTLQFREVHDGQAHLINAMYVNGKGTRRSFSFDMTELDTSMQFLTCDEDCVAMLTILAYYGVLENFKPSLEEFVDLCVPEGTEVNVEDFQSPYNTLCGFINSLNILATTMPVHCYSTYLIDINNFSSIEINAGDEKNHKEVPSDLDVQVERDGDLDEGEKELAEKYFINVGPTRKINIK